MLWNVVEYCGMLLNVVECCGMLRKLLECCGKFLKVVECCRMLAIILYCFIVYGLFSKNIYLVSISKYFLALHSVLEGGCGG